MDEGGHRRRAFHRVWQPDMQEELGRLAHRADEEEDADQLKGVDVLSQEIDRQLLSRRSAGKSQRRHDRILTDRGQDRFELHRAKDEEHGHDAERQAEVANAVGDKGLDGSVVRRLFRVPETDQQV